MISRVVIGLAFAVAIAFGQEQHTEFSRTRFEVIVPLLRQNRYAEAEELTRQLLAKAQAQLDPESLEIGRILQLLTDCRFRSGTRNERRVVRP